MPSVRSRTARWRVALGAFGIVVAAPLAVPVTVTAAAPPTVDDATIELAIDGLYSYLFRNAEIDPIVEPCPMLTPEQLGWYTQQWNVVPSMQDYGIDAGLNSDLGDNVSLYCGVDLDAVAASPDPAAPFGIGLEASYLLGATSLETVLAADEGAVLVPAVANVGGVLGGWCGSGANAVCLLRWSRNELLISLGVVGPPSGVQQQAMIDMFVAMLPEMITNLGAAFQETSGPTTLPSLPPLPQDQPTIPAATVAPPATTTGAPSPTTAAPPPATTAAPPPATTAAPPPATTAPASTLATSAAPAPTVPPAPPTSAPPTSAPATTAAVPTVPPVPTTATATTAAVPTVPAPTAPPPGPPATTAEPGDSVAGSTEVEVASTTPESGGADGMPGGAFVEGAAKIPAGTPGEVTVVMQSAPDGGGVGFIVRNDTDASVFDVEVSGVARDADGTLVSTGSASVAPAEIPPGGWAMGEITFGYDALAGDEDIELAVTGVEAETFGDPVLLTVTEASYSPGGYTDEIGGIAENASTVEVSVPRAAVACFDGSELTGVFAGHGDVDDVAAGATTPFSINVPGDVSCPVWVVVVEG